MGKVVLYIATSIDGLIARSDGSLDWLESLPNPENTDYGYQNLLNGCDSIVMGKSTYDRLLTYGMEWPYADFKTFVVSRKVDFVPSTAKTCMLNADIDTCIRNHTSQSDKDMWLVGGGKLMNYFLLNNLIDKMIIAIVPVILGAGIPMFPDVSIQSDWQLEGVESSKSGIVSLTYIRRKCVE